MERKIVSGIFMSMVSLKDVRVGFIILNIIGLNVIFLGLCVVVLIFCFYVFYWWLIKVRVVVFRDWIGIMIRFYWMVLNMF